MAWWWQIHRFLAYVLEGVQIQARKYGFNLLISYIDERAGTAAVRQQIQRDYTVRL